MPKTHVLTILLATALLLGAALPGFPAVTGLVSKPSGPDSSDGSSQYATVSANGRFVAFASTATNLVPTDTNGVQDIFVWDAESGAIQLVSVGHDGSPANGDSTEPVISDDGRYVAFSSAASNLVPLDSNGAQDIFVYDRSTGRTDRVSLASQGQQANGDCWHPDISADGRVVAFTSRAPNLAAGKTTSTYSDVFVRDRSNGQTTLVSVTAAGVSAAGDSGEPAVSANGRCVAFTSAAYNLTLGDTNNDYDVFVRDLWVGQTNLVSHDVVMQPGNAASTQPAISADGQFVAFRSVATSLVSLYYRAANIFLCDRATGLVRCLTQADRFGSSYRGANQNCSAPSISADGHRVAFTSLASNLISGDGNRVADIYVCDWTTISLVVDIVSVGDDLGTMATSDCQAPGLAAGGSALAFVTAAPLLAADTNGYPDVYFATPVGTRPAAPLHLVAYPSGDNAVALYWTDASSNESSFALQRRVDEEPDWSSLTNTAGTYFVDTPVWANHVYHYRVRAVNSYGQSGWSNEVSITPTGWRTERVNVTVRYGNNWYRNGYVVKPGATQIALHFTGINVEPDRDRLTCSTGQSWSGSYSNVYTTSQDGNVIGLTLASDVSITGSFTIDLVRYRGTDAGPAFFGGELFGGTPVPAPPSNLQAAPASSTSVSLSWTDNATNETSYVVERKSSALADFSRLATLGINVTQYPDQSCAPGMPYTYRVRAANGYGDSAPSNEATVVSAVGGYGRLQYIGEGEDVVAVLYTGGTPYEIGYWHGRLLRDAVCDNVATALAAAHTEVSEQLLLAAWAQLAPFVSEEFQQELQGLADGSGLPLTDLYQIHALPDLSEYHCSAFNAVGPATSDGHMIQLRNLDYEMSLGMQRHPLIIIGNPTPELRYANIGFAGFIGCIAGLNSQGLGVSEVGESFDYSFETLSGAPMPFLLRDIIAHATSLEQAVAILQNASRTSSLAYVVGDAKLPEAYAFFTSPVTFIFWGYGEAGPYHPAIPWVVYHGMYNERLHDDLVASWGAINPDTAMEISRHNADDNSNLMDAVYDLTTGDLWVAYAEGLENASFRPFVYLNINAWTPDLVPVTVTSVTPADGQQQLPPSTTLAATFSKPVVPSSLHAGTFTLTGPLGPVSGSISYDDGTRTATFQPDSLLAVGSHTARVVGGPEGVTGLAGATMAGDYTWSFGVTADTTGPQLTITSPTEGATVRGVVPLRATATDPSGVSMVEFAVAGQVLTDTTAPFEASWDTRPLAILEGMHAITVRATDTRGNRTQQVVRVAVDNTTFDDVPKSAEWWAYVEAIVREGIARGCSTQPPLFCPTSQITRGEMAVMLCRAAGLAPVTPPVPTFQDVPPTNPRYGYIEAVYQAGIAAGCSRQPALFCPQAPVTRGQMAVFLCRAAGIPPLPKEVPTFQDVPKTHSQYAYIEAICERGITEGCSTTGPRYCPTAPVTRAQMAVFICRAFGLSLD